ncbi:alpha/beta hydrolase [Corynebacterium aquatimens]
MDEVFLIALQINAAGFAGEAPEAGLAMMRRLARRYEKSSKELARNARVLETVAGLQRQLEFFADQLRFSGASPGRFAAQQAVIAWLREMGEELDAACAAELAAGAMCGAEAQVSRLADADGVAVGALNEEHLASAPPEVREAVERAGGTVLEGGPSGYTVMVGDAVNPNSIITVVSGVSSGGVDNLPGAIYRAQHIAEKTGASVVVWQGYDAPKDLARGLSPGAARKGADDLAAFQSALNRRYPDARQVVMGHSYGSVVTAKAAKEHGLEADAVVLAGSPGVPVEHADELRLLNDGHPWAPSTSTVHPGGGPGVYVADSDKDIIKALRGPTGAVHGYNPARPGFGATPIYGIQGGHNDYWDDPAFLNALKGIADGPTQTRVPSGTH